MYVYENRERECNFSFLSFLSLKKCNNEKKRDTKKGVCVGVFLLSFFLVIFFLD